MLGGDPARDGGGGRNRAHAGHVLRFLARARSSADGVGGGARDGAAARASWRQPGRARRARCAVPARSASRCTRACVANRSACDLGAIYPELGCERPSASCCRGEPLARVRRPPHGRPRRSADGRRRHAEERVDDGLPQDLEVVDPCLRPALLQGQADRQGATSTCRAWNGSSRCSIARRAADWRVTLDGNENFHDFDDVPRLLGSGARLAGAAPAVAARARRRTAGPPRSRARSTRSARRSREWPDRPPTHRRRIRRRGRRRAARARPRLRRRQPQELQGHRQGPRQRGACCTPDGAPARTSC